MNFKHLLIGLCAFLLTGHSIAATHINTPTVSGVWEVQNSPYYIYNNITVPANGSLQIKPGVEVIFMGSYRILAQGRFTAIGTPEQKITFKSNDTTGWHNKTTLDGGWKGLDIRNQDIASLSEPTLEYCIFRDMKILDGPCISSICQFMHINHCDFYHNFSEGAILILTRIGHPIFSTNSKLKFSNNNIYNNYAKRIMASSFIDSSIVTYNKFYSNQSIEETYQMFCYLDTNAHRFIFEDNEMYDNSVLEDAAILACKPGGHSIIRNNKFYNNNTVLKAAVSVQSITGIIDRNYIANNSRTQQNGFFCGINDGGAGLHLLGDTPIAENPGRNIYTVSNNVIVNNHSDIDGGGIWANHCKVNIVNNTIMNNTAENNGAAIHGWGEFCKVNVQNNIIHGNRSLNAAYDTGDYAFSFSPAMSAVNISNNLIEYTYTNAPGHIQGLMQNTYDHHLNLVSPTAGAGLSYNALNADFGPVASSLNIINKGDNQATDFGIRDYPGNARVWDNRIDIGAIEFGSKPSRVANHPLSGQVKLYPVPAHQTISLENNTGKTIKRVQLFTINGQERSVTVSGSGKIMQFDLGPIARGNYYIMLSFTDGQQVTKKFTIQ